MIPAVIKVFPERTFCLLGQLRELDEAGLLRSGNVEVVSATAPMYSLREQIEIPSKIPRATALYFATHYNVPLMYRGRLLVTVHDLFHLAMPHLVGGFHKRLYAKLMFNAVRWKADAIITISDFSRNELVRLTGMDRQQIYPIHLGVDGSWFLRGASSNPNVKPFLLFVGNIKPHKNLCALISAFRLLANQFPHDLVIVGKREGFITGDVAALMEADSITGRVRFTGRVEENVLRQYMTNADMLVLPSLYEGFGLPPLEAMAAGCPVIVSSAGALPEICGDAAIYCDPHNPADIAAKIGAVLADGELRRVLRERGLRRARQFTWDKCVSATCAVIEKVLAR